MVKQHKRRVPMVTMRGNLLSREEEGLEKYQIVHFSHEWVVFITVYKEEYGEVEVTLNNNMSIESP